MTKAQKIYEANARLIAAAPELLAALKDVANVLVEIQQYCPSHVAGVAALWIVP